MGFIALNCPNCGANIELDDKREFGFCTYCGTKIMQDKVVVEHVGNIKIDHSSEVNNLLVRAADMVRIGNYEDAETYYNRILDYDYNNEIARNELNKLFKIVKEPNLFISVVSGAMYSKSAQIIVYVNNNKIDILPSGSQKSFTLPVGKHLLAVRIKGTIGKTLKEITINDRFTKINLTVKCKFGNVIQIL